MYDTEYQHSEYIIQILDNILENRQENKECLGIGQVQSHSRLLELKSGQIDRPMTNIKTMRAHFSQKG